MSNITRQIVLIGGGYASIWAYRSIVEELMIEMMAGYVRIMIICPDEFHVFHGWTAECLVGIIGDQNRLSRLSEILKYAEFTKGRAISIDPVLKIIKVEMNSGANKIITYDQLLLGTGSNDSISVEGLDRNAFQLKSENDYHKAKMQIQYLIQKAAGPNTSEARKILRFTIAGSGFTGVEIASNLAEFIQDVKKQYPALRHVNPVIYLINSKEDLLPGLKSDFNRMKKYSEEILHKYGVIILNKIKLTRVTNQRAYLSDGSFIESEMVISTIGQTRSVLRGGENLDRDSENRIFANSFLQTKNDPNIWVAGDISNAKSCRNQNTCPSNALWAIKQGEHVGRNIARAILNQPLKPFSYRGLGQCASLGIGKGIGELYGIQFTGWSAWMMRWFFFQYFMPSKKTMWREIADWLFYFSTGRRKYACIRSYEMLQIPKSAKARTEEFDKLQMLVNPI